MKGTLRHRLLKDDKGLSIVAVVVLLVPITLMITSAFTLLPVLSRKARSDEDKVLSVLTAESGLQFGMGRLNSNGVLGVPVGPQTIANGGQFELTFKYTNVAKTTGTLECTGRYPAPALLPAGYDGRSTKLSVNVGVTKGTGPSIVSLLDFAHPIIAFGKDANGVPTVKVSSDSEVKGSVLLNENETLSTAAGVNGEYVTPQLGQPKMVPPQNPPTGMPVSDGVFNVPGKYEIDSNKVYSDLNIGTGDELTIDVGSHDVTMVVDNLRITGGGKLLVNAGKLAQSDKLKDMAPHKFTIYVNKTVELDGYGGIGHQFHPEAMFMFYNGTADFYLKDGSPTNAFAHFLFFVTSTAPNLYLTSDGFAGHFMTNSTGTVDMTGSFADCLNPNGWAVGQRWPLLVYAPSAHVNIQTTTIISGLICETLDMKDNAEIRAANGGHPVNVEMLPADLKNLVKGHSTLAGKDVFTFSTWDYIQ